MLPMITMEPSPERERERERTNYVTINQLNIIFSR